MDPIFFLEEGQEEGDEEKEEQVGQEEEEGDEQEEKFEVKVLAGVVPEVGFDEEEAPDAAVDAVNRDNAFNLGGEDAPAGGPAASDVGQVPAPLRRSGARRVVTTDDNHVGGGDVGSGSNDSVSMNIEFAD